MMNINVANNIHQGFGNNSVRKKHLCVLPAWERHSYKLHFAMWPENPSHPSWIIYIPKMTGKWFVCFQFALRNLNSHQCFTHLRSCFELSWRSPNIPPTSQYLCTEICLSTFHHLSQAINILRWCQQKALHDLSSLQACELSAPWRTLYQHTLPKYFKLLMSEFINVDALYTFFFFFNVSISIK